MKEKLEQHYRIKSPCANCPFRKKGAIELHPDRLPGIINDLMQDDFSTFQCHKTVHSAKGGEWAENEDGESTYLPSGHESMCAGAAAYLMKHGRPTVGMRLAFAMGIADPGDWDAAQAVVID
jgi:hypothetical protein